MRYPKKMLVDSTTHQTDGFSERLNLLLDYHPLIPSGRNRATALANYLSDQCQSSKTFNRLTVRGWILNNRRPSANSLKEVIELLLHDLPTHVSSKTILLWLNDGDEIYNPFFHSDSNKIDHLTKSKMYSEVDQIAHNLNIKIKNMDSTKVDIIYDTILSNLGPPDFDTFFTKPLILLESKNKLGTTLKVSVDYLIR